MGELVKVKFYGDQLWAYRNDEDSVLIALKPIVEGMGLFWPAQLERTKRDAILSEGILMTSIPSAGGDQETVCLPLHLIPGWLMGVETNRVADHIREKIIRYQRECYDVLAAHFLHIGLRRKELEEIINQNKMTHWKLDELMNTTAQFQQVIDFGQGKLDRDLQFLSDLTDETLTRVKRISPKRARVSKKIKQAYEMLCRSSIYKGYCACGCGHPIMRDSVPTDDWTIDHFRGLEYGTFQMFDGWPVAKQCNQKLENVEYRRAKESQFIRWRENLRAMLRPKIETAFEQPEHVAYKIQPGLFGDK
jgi:hypothetical protein